MPGRTGGVPRDTTVQIVVDGLSNPPMSVIEFELTIGEKKVRRLPGPPLSCVLRARLRVAFEAGRD